jgi:hypothetical protein
MMARRPYATECRGDAAFEHEFRREHSGAGGMASGGQGLRADPCVGIEVFNAFARRTRLEHLEIPSGVYALEFFLRCGACFDVQQVVV